VEVPEYNSNPKPPRDQRLRSRLPYSKSCLLVHHLRNSTIIIMFRFFWSHPISRTLSSHLIILLKCASYHSMSDEVSASTAQECRGGRNPVVRQSLRAQEMQAETVLSCLFQTVSSMKLFLTGLRSTSSGHHAEDDVFDTGSICQALFRPLRSRVSAQFEL
jgi:hypothetical protein